MTYLTTPNFYAGSGAKARLASYLTGARNPARSRAIRWARLGDSQETAPGGAASFADPIIAYLLYQRYGNIPETQAIACTAVGGGSPPAGIGIRTNFNAAVAAGDAATGRFTYNQEPGTNNRFDNSTPTTGAAYVLQANMLNVSSSATEIGRETEYIKRTGLSFHMLVPYLLTQGTSIAYRDSFSSTGAAAYFNANTATGTYDITAAQANDLEWLEISHDYNFGATPPTAANLLSSYPQHIVVSANASQVEFGPAWFASGDKSGIALTSWGAGSKKMADFLVDRPDWQLFGRAYDPNIVSVQFGANDGPNGTSAAQYQTDASDLVDALLHELPDATILLIPDPPRTGMTAGKQTEFNQYADGLYAVAQANPDTCVFLNVQRRMTDCYGWTNDNAQTGGFTTDGVHYSVAGSRLMAKETVRGMFRAAGLDDMDRTGRSRVRRVH